MGSITTFTKHFAKCKLKIPGKLIYYDTAPFEQANEIDSLSIFEIDAATSKLYCQNLCLLSKLYLDHKTLYFDVGPFMFYVLTEDDHTGSHIAGYFSKDKKMTNDCNLSCIMVLPPYQRKGYGKLLITLSYCLSKQTGRVCGPEKPLSDMGKVSYKSYWVETLLCALKQYPTPPTIKELSDATNIKEEDIRNTLQNLNLLQYWKSQYIIISLSPKDIDDHMKKKEEYKKQNNLITATFHPKSIIP
jgi:histone acetyltransferase MYST1